MGSVQNPYVISRCGIFNSQSSDLPHYPHTKLTTHTPSLISPPSLSLSFCLMYAYIHALAQLGRLTSHLCITQTSYTCVAGDNCPAGASLCRWSRLSCLPLHFFLSVCISVHLCCTSHSGSRCRNPVTALSAQNQHPLTVFVFPRIQNIHAHISIYTTSANI